MGWALRSALVERRLWPDNNWCNIRWDSSIFMFILFITIMIIGVISNIIHHNNSWKQLAAVERASDQKFFRLENLQIAWKWIQFGNVWFFILWKLTLIFHSSTLCRIVPGLLIIIAVIWKLHIFCLCAINRIVYFPYKYFLFWRWWACSHYIWEWLVGKNMMLFREQGNTIGSCWSVGDNIVHWWGVRVGRLVSSDNGEMS